MRILLWYWGRRGAGGQMTLTLAEALAARPGVEVALSISAQSELLQETLALGLPAETVPTYNGSMGFALGLRRVPALARGLLAQARAFRADAVLSVMTHLWTPLVAPTLQRAGIPLVSIVHDACLHPGDRGNLLWDWRLNRELDAVAGAIALSGAVEAALRKRRPGLPLVRLPLGAHLPRSLLASAPPPRRLGADAAVTEFLLFGRMRSYKGVDLLRDAFRILHESYPEARLRVIGHGNAEALAPGLSALPGTRVESRWVPEAEIPRILAAADALVLPYRQASQSGVIPLAFALGIPTVITPVGGLGEQVTDGVSGAVAAAAEPAALAAAMARLCDPVERARLAEGAKSEGQRLADWDSQAAALVIGLRHLVGAGLPAGA